ncbi:hypothetical protein Y032_0001g200 [Ancylostoma ceylanicum]|nr:hypothetical protein Y032_0001g200 [Ancylostoma ceylanicum]
MCMLRFLCNLIGSITAVLCVDYEDKEILWIGLGSFAWSSCYTVIVLNTVIAFHRLACTAFPLAANTYLSKFVLQIILAAIFLFFIIFVIMLNTKLFGVSWSNLQMTWTVMTDRHPDVFFL